MSGVWHWLGYWSGVTSEAGKGYAFWSGIGSCLAYLAILGAAWRHLNCHTDGCRRLGKHHVAGQQYKVCRRCFGQVTGQGHSLEEIKAAHDAGS